MNKKIIIINNSDGGLYVFRGPLIKRMIEDGYEVVSISPYGEFIDKVKKLGVKTYEVDFAGHSSGFLNGIEIIKKLYNIIKKENPDIVHNFTHKPNIFGAIAAKLAGVENIFMTLTGLGTLFTYHDFKTILLRKVLIFQYKFISKYITNIIFQNPDDLNEFKKLKVANNKKYILVNGSGVDLEDFKMPRNEEVLYFKNMIAQEIKKDVENKKIIIFPARALKEKGFFEFYEAAKIINMITDEYIFIHLGLVDKYSKYGASLENIKQYAEDSSVYYLGFKHNIKEYMMGSDIVVLSSSYREGTPRSLIEALSLNKMIITTNTPGCKETVIDGWNGYYCNIQDTNSLVSKIFTSNIIINKMENKSRVYCEKKYDIDIQYNLVKKIYGGEHNEV
jgi:N,N'-diacetylbacillosaminyl-diphospho-undecaprenol alpha-1,3-N-acetylgalactosaminyltransferase